MNISSTLALLVAALSIAPDAEAHLLRRARGISGGSHNNGEARALQQDYYDSRDIDATEKPPVFITPAVYRPVVKDEEEEVRVEGEDVDVDEEDAAEDAAEEGETEFEAPDPYDINNLDPYQIYDLIQNDTFLNEEASDGPEPIEDLYDDPGDEGLLSLPEETPAELSERVAVVEIQVDTLTKLTETVAELQKKLDGALAVLERHDELIEELQVALNLTLTDFEEPLPL